MHITDLGTVVAYGMVATAGDEITEALSDHYLLDFPLAEQAKRKINTEKFVQVQDILGFEQDIPKDEVIKALKPAIEVLASAISNEILRLNNNKPTKAVMLVGGGSLTPTLPSVLAEKLNLPANRVAVRGLDAIQHLTKEEHIPITPELVTPIGIAIAAKRAPIQYMSVQVNNQIVRLFELKEMTIADAFLAANISARKLYGKPGAALTVEVNGQIIHIPRTAWKTSIDPAKWIEASTKTAIQNNDKVELLEGVDGNKAYATVRDLLDDATIKSIAFQGVMYIVEPIVKINGKKVSLDTALQENDKITVETPQTVEQFLYAIHKENYLTQLQPYTVTINNKNHFIPTFSSKLLLNGIQAKLTYPVQENDIIQLETFSSPTLEQLANQLEKKLMDKIKVTFQNKSVELLKECAIVRKDNVQLSPTDIISTESNIQWQDINSSPWIFQDVFRFTEWTMPEQAGSFQILKNGEPSRFDEEIFGGDQLEIVFG